MITLTEQMFDSACPYDNIYQGPDKRLLFVCSAGLLRSATGANLYAKKGYNTRSCGSERYALIPITETLIHWAHVVLFVNPYNYESTLYRLDITRTELDEKCLVLNIEDEYNYNEPYLIELFETQIGNQV